MRGGEKSDERNSLHVPWQMLPIWGKTPTLLAGTAKVGVGARVGGAEGRAGAGAGGGT